MKIILPSYKVTHYFRYDSGEWLKMNKNDRKSQFPIGWQPPRVEK
ncbi:MAG: hypothetical protein PUJ87_05335 [Prevotellaceae bacterium]|nr:hypothetical protein [Prevotellaceae bacterium]